MFFFIKELADFKGRRNQMFKKSLTDFVEIQLKHANVKNFILIHFFKISFIKDYKKKKHLRLK